MHIVVLSTADWDHPFWTNKQHVSVAMANLGHRVLYIDSLGIRAPSGHSRDLLRLLRRLLLACRPPRRVRAGIWIWSPLVIPAAKSKPTILINRIILKFSLAFWMTVLRHRPDVIWTYNPMTLRYLDITQFDKSVYHCVDAIDAQPAMPSQLIRESEEGLCRAVQIVFTTSKSLQQRCQIFNENTYYFGNVADYNHFRKALEPSTLIPKDLIDIPKPRIGFVGAISSYKLDFSLLRELALMRPQWQFILIGKTGEGQLNCRDDLLTDLPNIHLLGPMPYSQLPSYLKGFDVGIIPAPINSYTQSMFPMKFFEYLAAGLPVVASNLDSLQEYSNIAQLCDPNPSDFCHALDLALSQDHKQCHGEIMDNSYFERTRKMMEIIDSIPC